MLFNCFKYINACFDVFFSQFGSGISVRVSCKARQAGPGTGSADSSDRSPPAPRIATTATYTVRTVLGCWISLYVTDDAIAKLYVM